MFRLIVLSVVCLASAAVGLESLESEDRIVNGRASSIHEFPYQVSLQMYDSHMCGASILSSFWILTAAHCVVDPIREGTVEYLSIRAGSSNWNSGGTVKKVRRAIAHPEYDPKSMVFDVALLELQSGLVSSAVIKPVTLARQPIPYSGASCVVSGWGKLGDTIEKLPTVLQSVTLQFLTRADCSSRNYGYGSSILESMICAVGPGKDSCQGDSGGPLNFGSDMKQIGVVSWGAGCAQPGMPGVYCDVTHPKVVNFLGTYVRPLPY